MPHLAWNVVYEISCPGCYQKKIGKIESCFETRLSKHSKHLDTRAVALHFLNRPDALYLATLDTLSDNLDSTDEPGGNLRRNTNKIAQQNTRNIGIVKFY